MKRIIISFALLLATTAAWAQTAYDPQVAYTRLEGRTTNLYLANADGSHVVRVASSANGFGGVDFAPGGGRIAFADRVGLKVLSYTASNTGIAVNSVTVVVAGSNLGAPDFSSDGSRILYNNTQFSNGASGIYAVPAGGGTSTFLHAGSAYGQQRWLRPTTFGNAFAFVKILTAQNVPAIYEIWMVLLDGNDNVVSAGPVLSTTSQAFKAIENFDTARTRDALLITANYPNTIRIVEFDLVSYEITDKAGGISRVHYSADDSRIISTDLNSLGSKQYVNSLNLLDGVTTRLTKAGNYGAAMDARP